VQVTANYPTVPLVQAYPAFRLRRYRPPRRHWTENWRHGTILTTAVPMNHRRDNTKGDFDMHATYNGVTKPSGRQWDSCEEQQRH
jgi:hypothetical protein